jgi:phosphoribosylanthranilate isomerase
MFAKICGITRLPDALHAVANGATALGFVFWPRSPRWVTADQARTIIVGLPPGVMTVGLFVDETPDAIRGTVERAGLTAVQLNDRLPPSTACALAPSVFKVVTLGTAAQAAEDWPESVTLLLDAHDPVKRGGTGKTVNWQRAAAIAAQRRLVLAGGLTPANVAEAIEIVRPFGVDVASGVESSPGVKDLDKVTKFLSNARAAFTTAGLVGEPRPTRPIRATLVGRGSQSSPGEAERGRGHDRGDN